MTEVVKLSVVASRKDAEDGAKAFKNQHALHVLLIMETLGVSKPQAEVVAWAEGREGYAKRMAAK